MPRFSFCRKWIWQSSLILTLLGGSVLPGKGECLSDSTSNRLRASTIPSLYNERDRTHDSLFLSATSLYLTGKEKEAEDAYLRLLEKDPENATAAFQIANILAERKNFSEAQVYAETACRLDARNEWFQLLLAQLYKTNREFSQAARLFAKLYELRPDQLDYAYEQANMHVLTGDLRSAIAVYDNLQERLGHTDAWSMQKYKLYLGLGDEKSARKEIEEISTAIPGEPKYLEMLAQMCMKEKDYKQAYGYLKKVLEIKPDDPYVHVSLVDYYSNTGNFKQAFLALEKAIGNPLLDFKTKQNLLRAYYTGKDELKPEGNVIEQTEALFRLLTETHPNEGEGYFDYARFQIMLDKPQKAIPMLQRSIELDSNMPGSWELLLLAANQASDTALMMDAGVQAAERFPEQTFPYMYLAIASFLENNQEKAVHYASIGRQRNRAHNAFVEKILLQILGDAYFELGRPQESLAAYQALFHLDPNDPYVRNNYAYYLALSGKELPFAEDLASQLCKNDPKNTTFLDTYAWVLYKKGEYGKALEYIKAAHKYDGGKDAVILEHYGDILYQLGKEKEATVFWEKACQKDPDNPSLQQKIKKGTPSWKE